MRFVAFLLVIAVAAAPISAGDDGLAEIDVAVRAAIDRGDVPGAVVLIVHRDKIVYRKAFGNRVKVPEPTLMTEDTLFDLASLTKPIATALAIVLLQEDGKLDVADPLAKHLPAFDRKETAEITLAQLLTHTAGFIPDNPMKDYQSGREKAWQNLFALKPTQPPGSKFVYSDVNFILLGAVVEKASGMPLDVFTRKRIFEPLGMKDTGFLPPAELKKRAAPTEKRDGRWIVGDVHDPRAHALGGVAGHAGLFSTADDLALLARMLLADGRANGKPFLRPETLRQMTAPRNVPGPQAPHLRTYGWDMATGFSSPRGSVFTKGTSYGHTGFTGTSLWLDPPTHSAVIILTNRVHPDGKGNASKLREQVATIAGKALGKGTR